MLSKVSPFSSHLKSVFKGIFFPTLFCSVYILLCNVFLVRSSCPKAKKDFVIGAMEIQP